LEGAVAIAKPQLDGRLSVRGDRRGDVELAVAVEVSGNQLLNRGHCPHGTLARGLESRQLKGAIAASQQDAYASSGKHGFQREALHSDIQDTVRIEVATHRRDRGSFKAVVERHSREDVLARCGANLRAVRIGDRHSQRIRTGSSIDVCARNGELASAAGDDRTCDRRPVAPVNIGCELAGGITRIAAGECGDRAIVFLALDDRERCERQHDRDIDHRRTAGGGNRHFSAGV